MKNAKLLTCPNCEKEFKMTEENKSYRPFCSKRCKMIDLGQWFGEKYVVEGEKTAADQKTDKKNHGSQN